MFNHIATDAASTTARFRMPALCTTWVSGASIEAAHGAAAFSFGYGVDAGTPIQGVDKGVRAWRPPV